MASFLKSIFGIGKSGDGSASPEVDGTLYKDFLIVPTPRKEGGQWRLAGLIRTEINGVSHERAFVRSDLFSDKDTAAQFAIQKGQLIIDQRGVEIRNNPDDKTPV
jgi:hypothetical protein